MNTHHLIPLLQHLFVSVTFIHRRNVKRPIDSNFIQVTLLKRVLSLHVNTRQLLHECPLNRSKTLCLLRGSASPNSSN